MKIKILAAALAAPLLLTACSKPTYDAPPASAAQVNVKSMSLAAQRFDQFCLSSMGQATDGVDLANAFYKTNPLPQLGVLKISGMIGSGEDIGVQYETRRKGCMITSSQGKSPNGPAEMLALANAYAAKHGGTVQVRSPKNIGIRTPSLSARLQFSDSRHGLYFLTEVFPPAK